jgi:hypothetical protein
VRAKLGISHGENEPRIAAQTRKAVSCKVNSPLSPERITVRADRGTPKGSRKGRPLVRLPCPSHL